MGMSRIDIIGQNGGDGAHYAELPPCYGGCPDGEDVVDLRCFNCDWLNTGRTEDIERPSCYDRAPWSKTVNSCHGHSYPFVMTDHCPHWEPPGGNAHVRAWCDSAGGKKTPWSACTGCQWNGVK